MDVVIVPTYLILADKKTWCTLLFMMNENNSFEPIKTHELQWGFIISFSEVTNEDKISHRHTDAKFFEIQL